MKIEQDQISEIEPFGMLDGKPVNLVRLKGGLNIATSADKSGQDQVLGAASHQAILCYTIEQRYPSFQPAMMKSDRGPKLNAESHSHFLTDDLRKSGHDIYSIQSSDHIDFYITKQNIKVGHAQACIEGDTLFMKSLNTSTEFTHSLSGAVSEKALSSGLKKVRVK